MIRKTEGNHLQISRETNNFDLMRLCGALFVFYSHSYVVFGLQEPVISYAHNNHLQLSLGSVGVFIFFVISGFLVTSSYYNHEGNLKEFFLARFLRIYPAYFVQYWIVCLVIGALATTWHLSDYFKSLLQNIDIFLLSSFDFFLRWLIKNWSLAYLIPPLPGVFQHNPIPLINGNLWTLSFEIAMYCLLPIILITQSAFSRFILPTCVFLYSIALCITGAINPTTLLELAFVYCWCFLLGSLLFVYRQKLRPNTYIAVLGIGILIITHGTFVFTFLFCIIAAYLIICIAFCKQLSTQRFFKYGDFSYGIYLYSFPVQQYFYTLFPTHFVLYFFCALAVTFMCAIASWYGVEKQALRLKKYSIRPLQRQ